MFYRETESKEGKIKIKIKLGKYIFYRLVKLQFMIHLLTAIGLTHGGSSTVHIYTKTIHRTTQLTTLTQLGYLCSNNLWFVRRIKLKPFGLLVHGKFKLKLFLPKTRRYMEERKYESTHS